MLNKLIHFFIIFLFTTIPLVNSHLLDFFDLEKLGKYFWVDGNYEFSKVIYFNIISGIILFLYFINIIINKQKNYIPKIIFIIYLILIFSTIFSISPEISLFGNTDKSHSFLMFSNLIGLYIILQNSSKKFLQKLLKFISFGLFFVIFFAIWQYFFPSFDYGELKNRAIGSFGHPNYLALYLLLFIPIVLENNIFLNKIINKLLIVLIIFSLFLTKSLLGIILLFFYLLFFIYKKPKTKIFFTILIFLFLLGIFYIIKEFSFEKLDSFLSRIFIWQTTLNINFSDIKIFFIGNGLETLDLIFDNFKSPYLYIFENFGFTADRPHNILLNIFYHTGIFGVLIFFYLILKLFYTKSSPYKTSLILAFIFLLFNYASIVSYLIIILFISLLNKNHNSILNSFSYLRERGYILNYLIISLITNFSIFGAYNSIKFYIGEHYLYNGNFIKSQNIYPKNPKFKQNINCKNLEIKSVENYFYCGNTFWKTDKQKAKKFYKKGLNKLPDLWNKNSKYFNNPLIKNNPQILHRFFSPKYSNLKEILEKIK